jgi:Fe2+ transport system protein FeoA
MLETKVIRADLTGETCAAAGATARGTIPVLALCRRLLELGLDPDCAVEVFRRGRIALRVRSIADGAKLTVKSAGNGMPVFALEKGAGASPVRSRGMAATSTWAGAAE